MPRRGEDRRRLLVHATFDAIAEKGFEGLRLRAVAAQAGIDHSTLHYYFPTRQDLVAAAVEFATSQFWTTTPDGGAPTERLSTHLATLARMIQQQPALFTVLREVDLRASRDPAVRDIVDRYEQGWRIALAGVFRTADSAVELVIAAVKGVSLTPDRAVEVLDRLGSLLAKEQK
ncbi:MAG: TetR/AcrR family transcriptional regulator [Pseudonocardiaceae bacterium]